jgi:hypothetical protein
MNNEANNGDYRVIDQLIQQENEEATRIFQKSCFESRVLQRIETTKELPNPSTFLVRKSIVVAVAALIIIVGGWVVIRIVNPFPYEGDPGVIEKVLYQIPSLQKIVDEDQKKKVFPMKDLMQEIEELKRENNLSQFFSQILKELEEV